VSAAQTLVWLQRCRRGVDPAQYVRRLDAFGATAFWQTLKRQTYALLKRNEVNSVLDVDVDRDDVRALPARSEARVGRSEWTPALRW